MTTSPTNSWKDIREKLLGRIHDRFWQPGEPIPFEADLALEFGCARSTVNRALRDLADNGLLIRKRRGGTRVAFNPPQRATFTISVLRNEVEAQGARYRHTVIERDMRSLPSVLQGAFPVPSIQELLYLKTLHFSDDRPFVYEERYINLDVVPSAEKEGFDLMSANEWLVHNAPYTHGDISFLAQNANETLAETFDCDVGKALFVMERMTWAQNHPITWVKLVYAPNFRMRTTI
ncbi:GntR family transcriptional regulator [Flexibacterium corallicola]|uniref:GntR family transcriptional regulator n=1 Tax=Flexibacterium corallicola TaxID=3037259 RepID=UPI00286F2594|nr:UTRA domain-containing protein [Pseudovibrio sp. M1P-2-3]